MYSNLRPFATLFHHFFSFEALNLLEGQALQRTHFCFLSRPRSHSPNGSSNPNRSTVLPLPKGEGRGEGEERVQLQLTCLDGTASIKRSPFDRFVSYVNVCIKLPTDVRRTR
jgi:hypothetical protein